MQIHVATPISKAAITDRTATEIMAALTASRLERHELIPLPPCK